MLGLLLLLMAVVSGQDIGGYCECKSCLEVKNDKYYYAEEQGDRCGQGCLMATDLGDDEICVCHAPINVTGGETAFVGSCLGRELSLSRTDKHIGLVVILDVPDGEDYKTVLIKKVITEVFSNVKGGCEGCLYYGFATRGRKVMLRVGYKDAISMIMRLMEVSSIFEEMVLKVGEENVEILLSGPQDQLHIIKSKLDELNCPLVIKFLTLEAGSMLLMPMPQGRPDTHVTILPEFQLPAGKVAEFKAGLSEFYAATKAGKGASGCLYYGFVSAGNSVYCREGYMNAEAVALHLADVKYPLDEALKVAVLKLNVVGPKAELDKLRPKLQPIGAVFWELDSRAFWE